MVWALLLGGVLFSGGCGCGGGSVGGPPNPDDGYNYDHGYYDGYYDHYYDGPYDYMNQPYGPYYNPLAGQQLYVEKSGDPNYAGGRFDRAISSSHLLRESRLTGASYIPEAEHRRVETAASVDLSDFGRLVFSPAAADGWPMATDVPNCAYAIYRFNGRDYESPVELKLSWYGMAPAAGNAYVGVWRRSGDRWLWHWIEPDRSDRVAVEFIEDCFGYDARLSVYVTVLVTGRREFALDSIALQKYR
jgi:hypothetical protein